MICTSHNGPRFIAQITEITISCYEIVWSEYSKSNNRTLNDWKWYQIHNYGVSTWNRRTMNDAIEKINNTENWRQPSIIILFCVHFKAQSVRCCMRMRKQRMNKMRTKPFELHARRNWFMHRLFSITLNAWIKSLKMGDGAIAHRRCFQTGEFRRILSGPHTLWPPVTAVYKTFVVRLMERTNRILPSYFIHLQPQHQPDTILGRKISYWK